MRRRHGLKCESTFPPLRGHPEGLKGPFHVYCSVLRGTMSETKRSSYPSKQHRAGPAPLASFEDLSDEIESPEELPTEVEHGELDLTPAGNDTEEEAKTYSDGVTPSTPRVLAQTPSTPLALETFSAAGTPDSLGPCSEDVGDVDSRPGTPCRKESSTGATSSSRSSIFSPRSSPLFGRRSKATTPDQQQLQSDAVSIGKTTEFLNDGRKKSGPGTPSPRSARKFFTMSFFKPREDKTPSPTSSPKSPRRTSPVSSPKSPGRRASPFAGLFKGSARDDVDATTTSSPTKKKGHFTHFLRTKEDKGQAQVSVQGTAEPGRKEGRHGVLATLFRRTDHKDGGAKSSPSEERDNWPQSSTDKDATAAVPPIVTEQYDASRDQGQAEDSIPKAFRESMSPADGLLPGTQGIFESSHDIAGHGSIPLDYDPKLRLGSSPSSEMTAAFPLSSSSAVATMAAALETVAKDVPSSTDQDQLQLSGEEDRQQVADVTSTALTADKLSPESEVELPEADPVVLKTLKKDEPEAETLLREDSFEADDFVTADVLQSTAEVATSTTAPPQSTEKEAWKHRDRIAAFRASPVDRPRSHAPISFASLDAYINSVAPSKADADVDTKEKLKVVLPGEEFEHRARSSGSAKKALYKSWFEFCEVGLQSPRSRRRQGVVGGGDRLTPRAPSSAPASRETTIDEDERRTESLDLGPSDGWPPSFEPAADTQTNGDGSTSTRFSDSSCSNSSDSSPKDPDHDVNSDTAVLPMFLRDEEVEPLVREVDSIDDFAAVATATMPDCVSSTVPATGSGQRWPPPSSPPPPPPPPLNGNPRPRWSGGVVDLLASLPSPKRDVQGSWLSSGPTENGRQTSSDSLIGSDDDDGRHHSRVVTGPPTSLPPLIPSKGDDA